MADGRLRWTRRSWRGTLAGVKLSPLSRARVALLRPLVRALFATPTLSARLGRSRAAAGLDPELAVLLAIDDLTHDSDVGKGSPEVARRMLAESAAIVEDAPTGAVRVNDHPIPGPAGALRARRYVPVGIASPSPGLVFFHGGGWVAGDLDTHDVLCRILALQGGIRVIAVDYRLAPEHRFPAAVDDAIAAFRWVAREAESLGLDPAKIGVGGDSAGGNLSAVVGLRTRGDARRPALAALLYPSVDATCASASHRELGEGYYLTEKTIRWYRDHYLGNDPARRLDPDASPLFAPDLAGAPPSLVVSAAFDPLRDEAIAYAARLREAGVPVREDRVAGMIHGFLNAGLSRGAKEATARIAREIGRALREGLSPG
ncbi:MAG: alpha/beta hydrolase [Byssovorax sp.]